MRHTVADVRELLENIALHAGPTVLRRAYYEWEATRMAGGTGDPGVATDADVAAYLSGSYTAYAAAFPPNQPPLPPNELRDRADLMKRLWDYLQTTISVLAPVMPPIPGHAAPTTVATSDVTYGPGGYPLGL